MANSRKTKRVPVNMVCHKKKRKSAKRVAQGKALWRMQIKMHGSKAAALAALAHAREMAAKKRKGRKKAKK